MSELPLSGGCLCGQVRFEVTEPPVTAFYCHCRRCQIRSGTAASANVRIKPDSLRILRGAELIREWQPETGNLKAFCSSCGSAIYARPPGDNPPVAVRLGAFDVDPKVPFSARVWVDSAAPWEPIPDDGLPRYPKAPS